MNVAKLDNQALVALYMECASEIRRRIDGASPGVKVRRRRRKARKLKRGARGWASTKARQAKAIRDANA